MGRGASLRKREILSSYCPVGYSNNKFILGKRIQKWNSGGCIVQRQELKKKNSLHSPDLKNLLLGTVTKFSPGACPKICLNTGREWV